MRITNKYLKNDNKHNTKWHDEVSKVNMSLCPEDMDRNKNNENQIKKKKGRNLGKGNERPRTALLTSEQVSNTLVPGLKSIF